MPDTVTIVAKGPSAKHAFDFINASPETLVATINDSANLLSTETEIAYCFFSHFRLIEKSSNTWAKTNLFISPNISGWPEAKQMISMKQQCPENFPQEKWITHGSRYCYADDELLKRMVELRQVIHHHTTSAAISWLIANDHKHIRIIGVDGGAGYADGVDGLSGQDWNFDMWKEINKKIAFLATEIHGTKFEWYGE